MVGDPGKKRAGKVVMRVMHQRGRGVGLGEEANPAMLPETRMVVTVTALVTALVTVLATVLVTVQFIMPAVANQIIGLTVILGIVALKARLKVQDPAAETDDRITGMLMVT